MKSHPTSPFCDTYGMVSLQLHKHNAESISVIHGMMLPTGSHAVCHRAGMFRLCISDPQTDHVMIECVCVMCWWWSA